MKVELHFNRSIESFTNVKTRASSAPGVERVLIGRVRETRGRLRIVLPRDHGGSLKIGTDRRSGTRETDAAFRCENKSSGLEL